MYYIYLFQGINKRIIKGGRGRVFWSKNVIWIISPGDMIENFTLLILLRWWWISANHRLFSIYSCSVIRFMLVGEQRVWVIIWYTLGLQRNEFWFAKLMSTTSNIFRNLFLASSLRSIQKQHGLYKTLIEECIYWKCVTNYLY